MFKVTVKNLVLVDLQFLGFLTAFYLYFLFFLYIVISFFSKIKRLLMFQIAQFDLIPFIRHGLKNNILFNRIPIQFWCILNFRF